MFRVLDEPSDADIECLLSFSREYEVQVLLQPGGLDSVGPATSSAEVKALHYDLPEFDVRIRFEPTDFVQINAAVNRIMVSRAIEFLEVNSSSRVLDLYCGIGNFSLPLARRAAAVLGLEGESRQVDRASGNAVLNKLDNCKFRVSDLAELSGREDWLCEEWDRVLLDPARSGAAAVVEHIGRISPQRIVYLSCHPATLARDAGELVNRHGYRAEAAGIIDMFPHTSACGVDCGIQKR